MTNHQDTRAQRVKYCSAGRQNGSDAGMNRTVACVIGPVAGRNNPVFMWNGPVQRLNGTVLCHNGTDRGSNGTDKRVKGTDRG